ncbi:type IV pilin protein [Salinivibrio proteolyticus]|uniref:type IV pilin protein n=1 Tax=Salinivibrio proteolyticus TaxID=334715 RepID=UPI0009892277|nr:type IV pilin protein [Salinivibrio proteolyticus]OOF29791.1 hypothetical protein BZJ20_13650 [Salinivibrio proteolyticus]
MSFNSSSRLQKGVTLVELLFGVAIIATLVGIALPVYSHYKQQQERQHAKRNLVQLQAWVEDHFITHQSFPNASDQTELKDKLCENCQLSQRYNFAVHGQTKSYYVTATPRQETSQEKDPCGALTLYPSGLIAAQSNHKDCPLPHLQAPTKG